MTRDSSGVDTKYVKEAAYEGETKVDEVVGRVIKRSKSYNIASQIELIISHKDIN